MSKLRKLNKKIIPLFKTEGVEQEKLEDELFDGEQGHGILVRKYIDNLHMDFYAGRSAEKGRETITVSFRIAEDVAKDISIMIASGLTRFRDRSEFFRTMSYIGLNYYAPIVKGKLRERVTLRDLEDIARWRTDERERMKNIIEIFNQQFPLVAEDGDEVLHRFISEQVEIIKKERRPHIRNKLIRAFSARMEAGGVNPSEYFEDYKNIKD